MVSVLGRSYDSLSTACKEFEVDYPKIRSLTAYGIPADKLIQLEASGIKHQGKYKVGNKEYATFQEACSKHGIPTIAVTKLRYEQGITEQEALDAWVSEYWGQWGYTSLDEAIKNTEFNGFEAENIEELANHTGINKRDLRKALQSVKPPKYNKVVLDLLVHETKSSVKCSEPLKEKLLNAGVSNWAIEKAQENEYNFRVYSNNLVLFGRTAARYKLTEKELCEYLQLDIVSVLRRIQFNLPPESIPRMVLNAGEKVSSPEGETFVALLARHRIQINDYISIIKGTASDELINSIVSDTDKCNIFVFAHPKAKQIIRTAREKYVYLEHKKEIEAVKHEIAIKTLEATANKPVQTKQSAKATAAKQTKQTKDTQELKTTKPVKEVKLQRETPSNSLIITGDNPSISHTTIDTSVPSSRFVADTSVYAELVSSITKETLAKIGIMREKQRKFASNFNSTYFKNQVQPGIFGTYVLARLLWGDDKQKRVYLYEAATCMAHSIPWQVFLDQFRIHPHLIRNIPNTVKVEKSFTENPRGYMGIIPYRRILSLSDLKNTPQFNPLTLVGYDNTKFKAVDTAGEVAEIPAEQLGSYIKARGITNAILKDGTDVMFIGG